MEPRGISPPVSLAGEAVRSRSDEDAFPPVLAGPVLRRATVDSLVLWLVTSRVAPLQLRGTEGGTLEARRLRDDEVRIIPLGTRAFLHLIEARLDVPGTESTLLSYDLGIEPDEGVYGPVAWIEDWAPHLCRPGRHCPDFVIKSQLDRVLHGSCRRPHHPAGDGLARVDAELLAAGDDVTRRPALLMLTGDQIYGDDVAGPMLNAIQQLIERLGLYDERIPDADVADSGALRREREYYYQRHQLLPETQRNVALVERFFGGGKKARLYLRERAQSPDIFGRSDGHVSVGLVTDLLAPGG